jgi:hypothetical protein
MAIYVEQRFRPLSSGGEYLGWVRLRTEEFPGARTSARPVFGKLGGIDLEPSHRKSGRSHPHVIKKLRPRLDSRDEQMVSGAGTGDVEQVALGVVDFLQVGVIAYGLDALL